MTSYSTLTVVMLATMRAPANSYMQAVDFLSGRLGASINLHWDKTITRITGGKLEPTLDDMFPNSM